MKATTGDEGAPVGGLGVGRRHMLHRWQGEVQTMAGTRWRQQRKSASKERSGDGDGAGGEKVVEFSFFFCGQTAQIKIWSKKLFLPWVHINGFHIYIYIYTFKFYYYKINGNFVIVIKICFLVINFNSPTTW